MQGIYDPWLVTLSVVVAVLASFAALDLANRVVASRGRASAYWLAGGALSMGLGIWSMHFIGMLAFHLPIVIVYDVPLTLGSIMPAILSSALALYTIRRWHHRKFAFEVAGLLVGIGISAMHYTGMAPIPVVPEIRYDPALVALSVVIAVGASYAALRLAFRFRMMTSSTASTVGAKISAAVVMGLAISAMHYCAMFAANFAPESICFTKPLAIDPTLLAVVIGAGALLLLATSIMVSIFDAHLAQQNATAMKRYNYARLAAEQASRAKSQFLAVMSHELRTPLNAIIGFTEAMAVNIAGPLNPRQIEYLNDFSRAGHQLLSLVNDILDLSKIEAERYEIAIEPVNLKETVSTAANLVAASAEAGGIRMRLGDIAPDHRVWVDPRASSGIDQFAVECGQIHVSGRYRVSRRNASFRRDRIGRHRYRDRYCA
jgi:NO-binding membrane sensor protein with MHYT domain